MEEGLKRQFDALCRDFGMSASTAFNVFARTVVRQRRIPFEISASEPEVTRAGALAAFAMLRDEASRGGAAGMTLDEINAEISAVRAELA
jgi:addiction module RelB/DinJ family antitoxin